MEVENRGLLVLAGAAVGPVDGQVVADAQRARARARRGWDWPLTCSTPPVSSREGSRVRTGRIRLRTMAAVHPASVRTTHPAADAVLGATSCRNQFAPTSSGSEVKSFSIRDVR